ncbi:acyltransferase [Pontibacillus halophilus JSM 076056 = DSM 19796]|uniref:Acyltransferase n=1 Tax=Pontibacillus halophilus JSM 076056 = DSM 19796 TaxID=1385510 RepID=A0A0A5GHA7_9BACI|nr:acyltransferase [Pontibacillus halophilus JSM 076056 = DSM 19796]
MEFLKDFYKKRVVFIVLPYVLWAIFYETFMYVIQFREWSLVDSLVRILHGESFYHLHFIYLIVQFYLFLPLLLYLTQKIVFLRKYLWLVGLLIQVSYGYLSNDVQFSSFMDFLGFMGPFMLGAWLGVHFTREKEKARKITTVPLAIAGLGLGVTMTLLHYFIYGTGQLDLHWFLFRLTDMAYLLVGGYALFRIAEWLSEVVSPRVFHVIKNIASYSFGFYLIHPIVLRVVAEFIPAQANAWFHVQIVGRYVGTLLFCYLIIWFFHRFTPFGSILFGKLPKRATFIYHRQTMNRETKTVS